MERPQIQ